MIYDNDDDMMMKHFKVSYRTILHLLENFQIKLFIQISDG